MASIKAILVFKLPDRVSAEAGRSQCPLCRDLDPTALDGHTLGLRVVYQAAEDHECRGCGLLLDGISKIPEKWRAGIDLVSSAVRLQFDPVRGLVMRLQQLDSPGRLIELQFFREDTEWKCFPVRLPASGDPADRASAWAKEMISHCINNHPNCKPGFPDANVPRRLIDVRLGHGFTADVNLFEPTDETCLYVCLSHCWGDSQPLKTLKGNLHDHKQSIAWDSLPRTFQDAINFTRKLNIPYIWIDSLSIVQDDPEDWRAEAAKMAHVYGNCHLCIAATHGTGATSGLFYPAEPVVKLDTVDDNNEVKHVLVEFTKGCQNYLLEDVSAKVYIRTLRNDAALLTRAWVIQERLLSPRVLHFFEHDLVLECAAGAFCGCGSDISEKIAEFPKISHAGALSRSNSEEVQSRWRQLVCTYTSSDITFGKDRLPAIAGLAHQLSLYRKDSYVAGLWTDTIAEDLLWRTSRRVPKPEKVFAPSWSWASVNQIVDFSELGQSSQITCKMLSTRSWSTDDVESASLEISGQIAKLSVCTKISYSSSIRNDYEATYAPETVYLFEIARDSTEKSRGIALVKHQDQSSESLSKKLLDWIGRASEPPTFQRIGFFQLWSDNGGLGSFDENSQQSTILIV